MREIIYFQTLDLTKFLTCSLKHNIDTISGTTHQDEVHFHSGYWQAFHDASHSHYALFTINNAFYNLPGEVIPDFSRITTHLIHKFSD